MRHALRLVPAALAGAAALTSAAAAAPVAGPVQDGSQAVYRATFDLTWSAATHPGNYPNNAHVSPPVGASHAADFHLWQPGALATDGIERMAETGSTSQLTTEINAAIAAGNAGERFQRGGFDSPASRSMDVVVTKEFPAISLVTMVAPSPDWFLGVDGVELLEGGLWVDTITVPLLVWDSGTDSGANFTSPNQNTNPAQPIALQDGGPFNAGGPALGTLTFTRVKSLLVYGGNAQNPAGTMTVAGDPSIGSTLTLTIDDPNGVMATPSQTILAVSPVRSPIFPFGRPLPGFGLATAASDGELLVGLPLMRVAGPSYMGSPVTHTLQLPTDPVLVGTPFFIQGVFIDPGVKIGLTDAVEVILGS